MKIRNRLLLGLIGSAGSLLVRVWLGSLRREIRFRQPHHDPLASECFANEVICIWHENLLIAAYLLSKVRQYTIISQSNDGEYIARIVERMGLRVIRGSSSRGAVAAVRKLIRAAASGERVHIGMTCDGPRGPRRQLKSGAVFVAAKAGMILMPIGIAYDRPWRANSWDRFALPRPFSRVMLVGGEPIHLPENFTREQLDLWQARAQEALDAAQAEAELAFAPEKPCTTPEQRSRAA